MECLDRIKKINKDLATQKYMRDLYKVREVFSLQYDIYGNFSGDKFKRGYIFTPTPGEYTFEEFIKHILFLKNTDDKVASNFFNDTMKPGITYIFLLINIDGKPVYQFTELSKYTEIIQKEIDRIREECFERTNS